MCIFRVNVLTQTLLLTLYGPTAPTTLRLIVTDPAAKNFAPGESRTRELRQNGIILARALKQAHGEKRHQVSI